MSELLQSQPPTGRYNFKPSPEFLARRFHEHYESLAPEYGYKTREATRVPWDELPADNKALMTAVAARIISEFIK